MRDPADQQLIESYRNFVHALITHTWTDHEGTEIAIGDFVSGDTDAADILRRIVAAQEAEQELMAPS